jgi:cytochrome-b5 reductase
MKSQWWTSSFQNPTAVLCPPGECVIADRWVPLMLRERIQETHDTALLTFELEDTTKPLGLPTCSFILARFQPRSGKAVVRPYTPVSTNALIGKFQILIKAYESGQMSQHLMNMPLGATVEFKHTKDFIKCLYPFSHKRITMLVGGTGITPMLQALHAILGTPGDETQVTMIYSNKRAEDVLCKELLDRWSVIHRERFRLIYVFSRDENIHIEKKLIKKHSAPPADDVMIMVCGPPSMYESLCGDRDSPALTGALRDLGYKAARVAKL